MSPPKIRKIGGARQVVKEFAFKQNLYFKITNIFKYIALRNLQFSLEINNLNILHSDP